MNLLMHIKIFPCRILTAVTAQLILEDVLAKWLPRMMLTKPFLLHSKDISSSHNTSVRDII